MFIELNNEYGPVYINSSAIQMVRPTKLLPEDHNVDRVRYKTVVSISGNNLVVYEEYEEVTSRIRLALPYVTIKDMN